MTKFARSLALVLFGVFIGAGVTVSAAPHSQRSTSKVSVPVPQTSKVFHVGVGKPMAKGHYGATATGGSLTVTRTVSCTAADGSANVTLEYVNASGIVVTQRVLLVPADRSKSITDSYGNVIAATVPTSTSSTIDSFDTNLDTQIGNAATAGKLNL